MKHEKRVVSKTSPVSSNPNDYIEYGYYDLGKTLVITYIKPFFDAKKK